jgi:hypothetical protein
LGFSANLFFDSLSQIRMSYWINLRAGCRWLATPATPVVPVRPGLAVVGAYQLAFCLNSRGKDVDLPLAREHRPLKMVLKTIVPTQNWREGHN